MSTTLTKASIAEGLRERMGTRVVLQKHQIPPAESTNWLGWVMLSGRGGGKSFAAMWWLHQQLKNNPGLRARVIAPTLGDAIAASVDGPNGLTKLSNGMAKWQPSAPGGAVIAYPNGSKCWLVGCPTEKDTDRLRALTNIDVDVFEEFFAIPVAHSAFTQAQLSRRRGTRRFLISSTPRPHQLLKEWEEDPRIIITRATSMDNKHIPLDWLNTLKKTYKGSRLYRQEVLGEVLEDVEGALWSALDIERSRVPGPASAVAAICDRIAVGVDPPTGKGTCGIVVVGQDDEGHLYVLDDRSVEDASPHVWAARVQDAVNTYDAIVVAEINQGGQMVKEVLNTAGSALPIETVSATKGKKTRAEPIALLWEVEEQIVHMVTESQFLIDQMCDWVPSNSKTDSPDRVDALVWACWFFRSKNTALVRSHTPNGDGPVGLPAGGLRSLRMGRY